MLRPSAKLKEVGATVRELESLLVSIDWSSFNPGRSILTERRVNQINEKLVKLSGDKTVQQFLYDTADIHKITMRLQPLAMISWMGRSEFSVEARIVIQKLISHQAYSNRHLYSLAVANLIELNQFIGSFNERDVSSSNSRWYRLFVVDHAVARMYTDQIAAPLAGDSGDFKRQVDEMRFNLISVFEVLSPRELLGDDFESLLGNNEQCDPYLLRVAHYFGHRGNERLSMLQALEWADSDLDHIDRMNLVSNLVEEGLASYNRAINLRLIAFAKSFGTSLDGLHEHDSNKVSFAVQWADSWMKNNEAFFLTSQALADIANQYAAATCVLCYKYAQSVYASEGNDRNIADEAMSYITKATYYWRKANINGTLEGIGEPYRIVARRRLAEHMVFIASRGSGGLPINSYDKKLENWEQDIFKRFHDINRVAANGGTK